MGVSVALSVLRSINTWLLGLALVMLVPVLVLAVEVLAAPWPIRRTAHSLPGRGRVSVLMPAHNEAALIGAAVSSVRHQLRATDRLLVVADNCTDSTVEQARAAGAEVVERIDQLRLGKSYALDFGLQYLAAMPPELVVIVDANCELADGALDILAACALSGGLPAQALYLMRAGPGAGAKLKLAEFAWLVRNQVRPSGLHRFGLPCKLMGGGMAFPWRCLTGASLTSGQIVKDMKLQQKLELDLLDAGIPPRFCPDAMVTRQFPSSPKSVRNQRTRWEQAHLGVKLSQVPWLLAQGLCKFDRNKLAMALDSSVPSLGLLLLMLLCQCGIQAISFGLSHAWFPLAISTLDLSLFGGTVMLAWARFCRDDLSFRQLMSVAAYPIWKIPLYLKFLVCRQVNRMRSKLGVLIEPRTTLMRRIRMLRLRWVISGISVRKRIGACVDVHAENEMNNAYGYDWKVGLAACGRVRRALDAMPVAKSGFLEERQLVNKLHALMSADNLLEGEYSTEAASIGSILASFVASMENV